MTDERPTHEELLVVVVHESQIREIFTQPGEVSDRPSIEERWADVEALPRQAQEALIVLQRGVWSGSWAALVETARITGSSDA